MSDIPSQRNLFKTPEDGSRGVWKDFQMSTTYQMDPGVLQIPVAGPDGTPSVFVKTHARTMRKIVSWRAMKQGDQPDMPDPNAIGNNDVFVGFTMPVIAPVLDASGLRHFWSVSGTYVYGMRQPISPTVSGLPAGASPVDMTSVTQNVLPAYLFRNDLLMGTDGFTGGGNAGRV